MEWFARRSINRLRRMLQSVRSRDFAIRVPEEQLHGSERALAKEINDVLTDFRKQMLDQERRFGQYEAILNTVSAAIIVAKNNGNVLFMNRQAIEGLCGFSINNISSLEAVDRDLPAAMRSLTPGQAKSLTLRANGKEAQVKISMVRYNADGETLCLYSIEDIHQLLLQNEIEAQRKLISVLTHEIMNSLSPIMSLSDTLCQTAACTDADTAMALQAINRRSKGLLTFVENFRKLSKLSSPKLDWVKISDIFDDLRIIYANAFIAYDMTAPDMELRLDRNQILHVMINLMKNAVEACGDNPSIVVTAKADHLQRRFIISVEDNGCGISPEAIDSIFLPFYTTKPDGSGIGLSLSRQIVSMHGGSLQLEPSDAGAKFTITLPLIYRIQ